MNPPYVAHDGRYDRVLEAYARSDAYLAQLWSWLQSQPDYKGRTHVLIATDHGRGRTAKDWRHHGAKVEGAGFYGALTQALRDAGLVSALLSVRPTAASYKR
jgi:hypothetical protein